MYPNLPRRAAGAVLAVALLGLTACGDDDKDAAGTPPTDATPSPTATTSTKPSGYTVAAEVGSGAPPEIMCAEEQGTYRWDADENPADYATKRAATTPRAALDKHIADKHTSAKRDTAGLEFTRYKVDAAHIQYVGFDAAQEPKAWITVKRGGAAKSWLTTMRAACLGGA